MLSRSVRNHSSWRFLVCSARQPGTLCQYHTTASNCEKNATRVANYSTAVDAAAAVDSPSQPSKAHSMDFENPQLAYSALPTSSLVRALFVFKLCTIKPIVENAESLLATSRRVLGDSVVAAVVRPTFFAQFCAGETEQGIKPTIDFLHKNGVGAILDYAAEADITPEEEECAFESGAFAERYEGVASARVYDYQNEVECDRNAQIFDHAIRAVHDVSPEGFAAIKITALGNPALLERWSTSLVEIRNLFQRMDSDGDGMLTLEEFLESWNIHFVHENYDHPRLKAIFDQFDPERTGKIDAVQWTTALRPEVMYRLAKACRESGPFAEATLNQEEVALMQNTYARVQRLVALAADLDVRLMIDAEHSYFQPAIDNIVLDLQREFNRAAPRVFNTFQCYLKETDAKLAEHISRAEKEGFHFAAKVVRGAYMVLERQRASEMGYPSPIHDTIEQTHACYDRSVQKIMNRPAVRSGASKANVLVATHNQKSVENAVRAMSDAGLEPPTSGVSFGQLLGMSDHLTFPLGQAGYRAYKYVPYGPIHEVLPYLVRRAQENSDFLGGVTKERAMLFSELLRRLRPFPSV